MNTNMYQEKDHTFVISAYKESPYLESCIRSCLNQSLQSRVLITTSTPNDHIFSAAQKYRIPVSVRHQTGETNTIGTDWNFAISAADTPLVTIAHQDDRYGKRYKEHILQAANACSHPLILFTDYAELRNGQVEYRNRILAVKRLLLHPLAVRKNWDRKWIRRRILSLGNPICAPSVTFVRSYLPKPLFQDNMISNIDWQAWEEISRLNGEFAYIPVPSMLHRIHEGSTTSGLLRENGRRAEDLQMYRKFWPEPVAKTIEKLYQSAEKSNQL